MNSPEHLGRESPELHFHNLLNSLVSFKRDLEGISDSTNKRSAQELVNAVYRLLAQDYNKLCGHISHEHSQELAQAFIAKALASMGLKVRILLDDDDDRGAANGPNIRRE